MKRVYALGCSAIVFVVLWEDKRNLPLFYVSSIR